MNGDALRAGELADDGRGDRIGLVGLARLADRGDVIDVDGETHGGRLADRCHSRRSVTKAIAAIVAMMKAP